MDGKKVKLAIAPIAWTNDDMPDLGAENTFAQCVSEMALSGFKGCEVGNKYPKDPVVLKRALDMRGLKICNQWFSSFVLTQPMEEVEKAFVAQCEFLRAMGADCIGASEQSYSIQGKKDVPVFGNKYIMNDGEWKKFADGMNRLGAIAKSMGLKLVYHHHMGTVVQTAEEVDRMMEMTDPEVFGLLFDRHIFVYNTYTALTRHSDCEFTLSNGIHRRTQKRYIERYIVAQLGRQIYLIRQNLRKLRNQQYVVKSQTFFYDFSH